VGALERRLHGHDFLIPERTREIVKGSTHVALVKGRGVGIFFLWPANKQPTNFGAPRNCRM